MSSTPTTITKSEKTKSRKAKRTDKEIAIALLKTNPDRDPPPAPSTERETYKAFHEEMKERHTPFLPIHFDIVQRATQLRWRLAKINKFEDQLFVSLREVSDLTSSISPERRKQFMEFFEMMLRLNGLEKIAKYEAGLSEEVRQNNHELEEVADWQHREGFKRGQIGYHISKPIDSGMQLCYDEPQENADQDVEPSKMEVGRNPSGDTETAAECVTKLEPPGTV